MSDKLEQECEDAEYQMNDLIHDLAGEIPEINVEAPSFVAVKNCLARISMAIRALKEDRDRFIKERDHWKANHDHMAEVKRAVLDRPDLKDRAGLVLKLVAERDQFRERCGALLSGSIDK